MNLCKTELNHKVTFTQFWEGIFGQDGCQHTVVIHQSDSIAIVYGYDEKTKHYLGLLQESGDRLNLEAVKARYLLPMRQFTLIDKQNQVQEGFNPKKIMQIP